MDLYKNIRKKREEKNYSQEYMAAKIGISQNAYSRIEQGRTKIHIERLLEISKVLEVPLGALLGDMQEKTAGKPAPKGNDEVPINEIKLLYEKLLQEKDLRIKTLENSLKGRS